MASACASRELVATAGIAVPGLTSPGASTNAAIASSDSREPTSASESRGFTANAWDVCPEVERRWQPMQLSSVISSKPPSASTTGSEADRWKRSNTWTIGEAANVAAASDPKRISPRRHEGREREAGMRETLTRQTRKDRFKVTSRSVDLLRNEGRGFQNGPTPRGRMHENLSQSVETNVPQSL